MGRMIAGAWHTDDDLAATDATGEWHRAPSELRAWLTRDGSPGPGGEEGFRAVPGRYHLYVAWNCPWAHRALLIRALKGLEDIISVSFVSPRRTDQGWVFDTEAGYTDDLFGVTALHEIYARGAEDYTGRVTVPVLFDKQSARIVSNESTDIVRMLNDGFADFGPDAPDFYPAPLRSAIDDWNERIQPGLNNGVYRAGFATTQAAYETAAREVFDTLAAIEDRLETSPWLAGDRVTEADIRLFPTLARFDVAYHYAFKCNLWRLSDYPRLWRYARTFYALPGVVPTVDFDIYKRGYFSPSAARNPYGIVPLGPDIDWGLDQNAGNWS